MSESEQLLSIKKNVAAGLKHFVDECIRCGKCLERCPVFLEPKFELAGKGPVAVIEKVLDLLKGGAPSEEAYRMAYGCAVGCTNICLPACPKGLELLSALIIAGQQLRTAGEGLPPLTYHHTLGHRYAFGHVFGNLQMKDSEAPWRKEPLPESEAVDVVLFVSCNAHGFPHLVLEVMDILKMMKVNFATVGARDLCCGGMPVMLGNPEETAAVSTKYISTITKFGAKKVVSICPGCASIGSSYLPKFFSVPFESFHITEFLADNLDKLPFTQPLNKVVTLHDACSQRKRGLWDVPRKLLRAIPGVTLVEMEHNRDNCLCCGVSTNLQFPGSMNDLYSFGRLDEAKATGADVMTTVCPGCQLAFCSHEKEYDFEIKHVITLVAEAMGIHHKDKLKKYLRIGNPDQVLDEASDFVAASDLSLLEFKQVLPSYFDRLCVSRGALPKRRESPGAVNADQRVLSKEETKAGTRLKNKKTTLRTERLPLDFLYITKDWLSRTLQLEYPNLIINDMEVVEIILGHDTKMRIKLDLNQAGRDAGIPQHVCLKGNLMGHLPSRPVCVTEARFYDFFRRLPDTSSIVAPACYFADWDDDAQRQQGIVILDDLIELGGTFGHSHLPIGLEEMARSLEGLAAIHGSTWGSKELDSQTWLQTAMAPETVTDDYWSMIPDVYERHNKIPERVAVFPKWMADDPSRLRKAGDALRAYESRYQGPRCLLHGDAHLGNSCLLPNGKRVWFDWQIVRKGLPWRDLTYFLIGSLTIEDRRKGERDLLRHYLDHFVANGGKRFTFEEVWEEYRRMVIWGMVAWQSTDILITPGQPALPSFERFCAAEKDLESHKLLDF